MYSQLPLPVLKHVPTTAASAALLSSLQSPAGAAAIRRSIQGMLEELEYNLWEAHLARLVDYGHTISPELEMAALRCVGARVQCSALALRCAAVGAAAVCLLHDTQCTSILVSSPCDQAPAASGSCTMHH